MANVYIFLGPPGAGKGTLGDIFCEKTGVVHISTGQLLRDELAAGTELGKKAQEMMKAGGLVSDDIVTAMVAARLAKADVADKGALLDGFPRTVAQADSLEKILADCQLKCGAAVLVDAPRDILMKRLTGRRMCSNKACGAIYNIYNLPPKQEGKCDRCGADLYQRADDTEATAVNRLKVYDEQTAPVMKFYRDRNALVTVQNSDAPVAENYMRLAEALKIS